MVGGWINEVGHAWAVTADGRIFTRKEDTWRFRIDAGSGPPVARTGPSGVFALSVDEAWFMGSPLLHFKGEQIDQVFGLDEQGMQVGASVAWGASADDIWFGGTRDVYRWDGTRLARVLKGWVTSLHGSAADNVWGLGYDSMHWDGAKASLLNPSPRSTDGSIPTDVWSARKGEAWGLRSGRLIRLDGKAWIDTGFENAFGVRQFCGRPGSSPWLIGAAGTVVYRRQDAVKL